MRRDHSLRPPMVEPFSKDAPTLLQEPTPSNDPMLVGSRSVRSVPIHTGLFDVRASGAESHLDQGDAAIFNPVERRSARQICSSSSSAAGSHQDPQEQFFVNCLERQNAAQNVCGHFEDPRTGLQHEAGLDGWGPHGDDKGTGVLGAIASVAQGAGLTCCLGIGRECTSSASIG